MSESGIELLRRCGEAASRVNPESQHRRLLRKVLRWHELDVMEALLLLDRIAQVDPTGRDPYVGRIVSNARAAMLPLYESGPV